MKRIAWNKGKRMSEEQKLKISNTLKNNKYEMERIRNLGKKRKGTTFTEEQKLKLKLNRSDTSGKNNSMFGKKHSEETKLKMSRDRSGSGNAMYGKQHSEETRKKISNSIDTKGSKNPRWLGGISFEPYGIEFNNTLKEQVRKRDKYLCRLCSKKQKNKKLHVHHIDYNKQNNNPENLISLCVTCHLKTNFVRIHWTVILKSLNKLNHDLNFNYESINLTGEMNG